MSVVISGPVPRQVYTGCLLTAAILASTVVSAQNASPERTAKARSSLLEEVVVTAQKREEMASDVPISIAAFSGDQLESLGIDEPNDLSALAPSLQFTESVGFSVVFLRGVGTDAFLMADPSVALYQDDVYMPQAFGGSQKFGNVDRVEILKGPQGTIFGRNATGGAINVHTKKPSFEAVHGSVNVELGNYDKLSGKAYVNLPILDNLAFSASAFGTEYDSFYDARENVTITNPEGTQLPGHKSHGFQIKAFYEISDRFDLLLNATQTDENDPGTLLGTNTEPSTLGRAVNVQEQSGRDNIKIDGRARRITPIDVYSAVAKGYFDHFDMKLVASHQKVDGKNQIDIDGSTQPLVGFTVDNAFAEIDQLEFQITSNENSWKADKLEWLVGIYGYKGTSGITGRGILVGTDLDENTLLGLNLPAQLVNFLAGVTDTLGIDLPSGKVIFDGYVDTISYAGFAQATWRFTDSLSLTLGGRYTDEERSVADSRTYLANEGVSRGVLVNDARSDEPLVTRAFSPRVAFEYRPTDDLMFYITGQQAIKSATFNVINLLDQLDTIGEEEMTAYELGTKVTWQDGLIQLNAAVFDYIIDNPQVQYFSVQAGGAIGFENAQEASIRGVDFDLKAALLPDTVSDLFLTLSGAYIDAEYSSFTGCTGYEEETGLYSEGLDCTGKDVTRSPKVSGRLGLNKIIYFDSSSVEIAGDYYYNSGFFYENNNRSSTEQPKYEIYNAHASYRYDPYAVSVTAYIKNITDEEYIASGFGQDFGNLISLAAPRTYGVKIGWEW